MCAKIVFLSLQFIDVLISFAALIKNNILSGLLKAKDGSQRGKVKE